MSNLRNTVEYLRPGDWFIYVGDVWVTLPPWGALSSMGIFTATYQTEPLRKLRDMEIHRGDLDKVYPFSYTHANLGQKKLSSGFNQKNEGYGEYYHGTKALNQKSMLFIGGHSPGHRRPMMKELQQALGTDAVREEAELFGVDTFGPAVDDHDIFLSLHKAIPGPKVPAESVRISQILSWKPAVIIMERCVDACLIHSMLPDRYFYLYFFC